MTSTISSSRPAAERVVRKHPVRGAIWGLLLGISLALYAVLFAIIPFTDWVPLGLVVVVGIAIGVAWAYFAPARSSGQPPSQPASHPAATAAFATATPDVSDAEPDVAVDEFGAATADEPAGPAAGDVEGGEEV